jgi:hypothetical protein
MLGSHLRRARRSLRVVATLGPHMIESDFDQTPNRVRSGLDAILCGPPIDFGGQGHWQSNGRNRIPPRCRPSARLLSLGYRCRRAHQSGLSERRAEGSRDFARLGRSPPARRPSRYPKGAMLVFTSWSGVLRFAVWQWGSLRPKCVWGFATSHDVRIDLRIINRMRAGHRWWLLRRGRARRSRDGRRIRWRILHRPLPWIGRRLLGGPWFWIGGHGPTQRAGHRFGCRRDRHAWRSSLSRSNLLLDNADACGAP